MKIAFLITARLKSTRLKRKIVLDLNGKSVVERVIERAKSISGIDNVILCTSTEEEDKVLLDIAEKNGILSFCGSGVDVMDRLMNAALSGGYDAFLSITADNPLFSIATSNLITEWLRTESVDFIYTKGLPIGCGTYGIEIKAMQIAHLMKKEADTEIWGPFINRPDFFNIGEIKVINSPFSEEKRITCDFPEDYEMIKKIYNYFQANEIPDLKEVFDILVKKPEIFEIISMHTQRQLSPDFMENINRIFEANCEKGMKFAHSIGKTLKPGFKIREFRLRENK
jgi:spore coat polysaccharide biosynthesis protein SpsF